MAQTATATATLEAAGAAQEHHRNHSHNHTHSLGRKRSLYDVYAGEQRSAACCASPVKRSSVQKRSTHSCTHTHYTTPSTTTRAHRVHSAPCALLASMDEAQAGSADCLATVSVEHGGDAGTHRRAHGTVMSTQTSQTAPPTSAPAIQASFLDAAQFPGAQREQQEAQHAGTAEGHLDTSQQHIPPLRMHTSTPSPAATRPAPPRLQIPTPQLPTSGDALLATSTSTSLTPSTRFKPPPPPLLLSTSASPLSSPSSLALSASISSLPSPITPSFSNRRGRNAKQLSLLVPRPSLASSSSSSGGPAQSGSIPLASSSARPSHLAPGPLSPNTSAFTNNDRLDLDLSETRSCPPTPRLVLDMDKDGGGVVNAAERDQLKSSLSGEMSMKRRTSLPRLNILATRHGMSSSGMSVPPTPSVSRGPKTGVPALTVESLVARNKEAGAPLDSRAGEAAEEFPYQYGPKEILPGLFLGSEQNAKDPAILRHLGITQVICCAKEVACPWLDDEIIEEDEAGEDSAAQPSPASAINHDPFPLEAITSNAEPDNSITASPEMSFESTGSNYLVPPPSSRDSRSPRSGSPGRPLMVRPTASTPNLKAKFTGNAAVVASSSPALASPSAAESMLEPMLPTRTFSLTGSASRRTTAGHSGYLHRQFAASRLSGRPALEYTKLPWGHDEDNIASHFDNYKICDLIDSAREKGGRCLIHCQLGVSRSATLMIGYCMRQAFLNRDDQDLEAVKSMHDSYTFVRGKSRWVAPNIGLLAQLVQYERSLLSEGDPEKELPFTNSAYYDGQLSLPSQPDPRTPDGLSPSSTSESDPDSRLITPESSSAGSAQRGQHAASTLHSPSVVVNEQLSPMTAAMRLSKTPGLQQRTSLAREGFGSAHRKNEHRKTFSTDFTNFVMTFSQQPPRDASF